MAKTRAVNIRYEKPDLYVGRPGPWGNPFPLVLERERGSVLRAYRSYLCRRGDLLGRLDELKGLKLGCHCKPAACHADVLAELAEMTPEQRLMWQQAVLATEDSA